MLGLQFSYVIFIYNQPMDRHCIKISHTETNLWIHKCGTYIPTLQEKIINWKTFLFYTNTCLDTYALSKWWMMIHWGRNRPCGQQLQMHSNHTVWNLLSIMENGGAKIDLETICSMHEQLRLTGWLFIRQTWKNKCHKILLWFSEATYTLSIWRRVA